MMRKPHSKDDFGNPHWVDTWSDIAFTLLGLGLFVLVILIIIMAATAGKSP